MKFICDIFKGSVPVILDQFNSFSGLFRTAYLRNTPDVMDPFWESHGKHFFNIRGFCKYKDVFEKLLGNWKTVPGSIPKEKVCLHSESNEDCHVVFLFFICSFIYFCF